MEIYKILKPKKLSQLGVKKETIDLLKSSKNYFFLKISNKGDNIHIVNYNESMAFPVIENEVSESIIFNILTNVQSLIEQKSLKLC